MDHEITVRTVGDFDAAFIRIDCSCGRPLAQLRAVTLDELNKIAHDHIESAERKPIIMRPYPTL